MQSFPNLLDKRTIFFSKTVMGVRKDFNLNGTKGYGMENLTHVPSEKQNLKTERLISCKCLIYRKSKLIFRPMSTCQESLPIF